MIELASILILGIFAQWLSWRIRVPAILPLILIGLLVGPLSTLWSADGLKWIQPIFDGQRGFFPGESLFWFDSLAIGVILFEGGLTLKRKELKGVGPVIVRLISIGSIITFFGAGLAAKFLLDLSWSLSFLFGALIIVTGPTVIAPILRNVPLTRNISTVLKWEGILIDPIGALVAVLVFEFIISGGSEGANFTAHAFQQFFVIILSGLSLGVIGAYALYQLIKRELIPKYLLSVFTLAWVLGLFVLSDFIAHESGLLTVVIMGLVMGNLDIPRFQEILSFKESLSVLLISILFILLAANINMEDLRILGNWKIYVLFGIVILVLRPLGVFLSTMRSNLSTREKIYISTIAPRGIVAAGIASLFGIALVSAQVADARLLTPLVFFIVLATVLLTSLSARVFAKALGVTLSASNGVLFIGANKAARIIASYLKKNGRHVVLVDANRVNVSEAKKIGLEAFVSNIFLDDLSEEFDLLDMGFLVAMTASSDVNTYAIKKFKSTFGENGTFRLLSSAELQQSGENIPGQSVLSYSDDYINMIEVARDFPHMHELLVDGPEDFQTKREELSREPSRIPLFLKKKAGNIEIIPASSDGFIIEKGDQLVYMGESLTP
jgi:NhaP-type Na+/H+ or K+/H+ antiporter